MYNIHEEGIDNILKDFNAFISYDFTKQEFDVYID